MTSPLLEVRKLCKSYDEGRIEALRGVDLSIAAGEYVAISGPSGSGKSTLLHLLGGLDTPTSGQVLFLNQPLGSAVDLDDYRAHQVGFIFQAFYLLPTLDALENVQVPMLGVSRDASNRAERAECLLREVGLENRLHQYPNELSILLADEPTGNLDSMNSARIMEMLVGIQQKHGMTLIVITHENEIADSAPRHIRMRDGLRIDSDERRPES